MSVSILALNLLLSKFSEIYGFDLNKEGEFSFASGAVSFKLFVEDFIKDPEGYLRKWELPKKKD